MQLKIQYCIIITQSIVVQNFFCIHKVTTYLVHFVILYRVEGIFIKKIGGSKMKRKEKIREYYLPKLKNEQSEAGCLGWENQRAQELRFKILERVIFSQASVLDVGCGLGNLYDYLKNQGYEFEYTGVDILPEMIYRAKEKNPQLEFICGNIFIDDLFGSRKFDIVYASGIFNIELGNNEDFLCSALRKFVALSNKFVVFNLLHNRSKTMEAGYYYQNPDTVKRLLAHMKNMIFKNVIFIDDYLDNDFSTILEVV